jgi:DNA-binding transcriptional MerR regulator
MNPPALVANGDFSRAIQMSVKVLRHYHQIGLLEPVEVDRCTGSRRDSTDQISMVQITLGIDNSKPPLSRTTECLC